MSSYQNLMNNTNYFYNACSAVNANMASSLEAWLNSNNNLSREEIYVRMATDIQSSWANMAIIAETDPLLGGSSSDLAQASIWQDMREMGVKSLHGSLEA